MSHYSFKESPYSSHALVLRLFSETRSAKKVLDVGCGNGYLGAILAERGYEVVGIERPGGWTSIPSNVRLIEADLDEGLPAVDEKFDSIICADILEHVRRPEELLRQLAALLAPDGVIVASLPNSGNIYFRLVVLSGRFPKEDKGLFDRTHIHFHTFDSWQGLFEEAGLGWLTVQPSGIPIGLRFPDAQASVLVRSGETICYLLARWWKRLFAYQFVVVAQRR
ncbi:MAG: class I SAM-dependent methyltransferase [Bryobacterales bacterium]|nr:class I SAM-dependent methyltransferase [Bryobacterales bacterium]